MKDLTIALENRPGALAEMGDALGRAGVSIEGGGAWVVDGQAVAHFLCQDVTAARSALEAAGIRVLAERDVLIQRLSQAEPGQLGKISRRMAEAGVNIEVLYSDHEHRLILVVDDTARGRAVSAAWTREQLSTENEKHQRESVGSQHETAQL
ncbi:MAG: amino acid-binding protein [Terracidiphilus sp.]